VRGTYKLSNAEGRDRSGHQKKMREQGALTNWRVQMEGKSGQQKKSGKGTLTSYQVQRTRQITPPKETEQARGTHKLSSAEKWKHQFTKRKQVSKGYSRTVRRRVRGCKGAMEV
jgi:hypothetical protein